MSGGFHAPNSQEVSDAREIFRKHETRDLFYRAATELVQLSLDHKIKLTVAEALAVLLQTWNKNFYRFHGNFDEQHFNNIERLLSTFQSELTIMQNRSIISLDDVDKNMIFQLFEDFEKVLGAVGASKALHLLCPNFFPLWDGAIARAYKLPLGKIGTNKSRYWEFMLIAKKQCQHIAADFQDHLKAVDEYNYCRYTRNWI